MHKDEGGAGTDFRRHLLYLKELYEGWWRFFEKNIIFFKND